MRKVGVQNRIALSVARDYAQPGGGEVVFRPFSRSAHPPRRIRTIPFCHRREMWKSFSCQQKFRAQKFPDRNRNIHIGRSGRKICLRSVFALRSYSRQLLRPALKKPESSAMRPAPFARGVWRRAIRMRSVQRRARFPATTLGGVANGGHGCAELIEWEVQARGRSFAADRRASSVTEDAHVAPELLAALPTWLRHRTLSVPRGSPRHWTAAAQEFNAKDYASARHALESLIALSNISRMRGFYAVAW